MSVLRLRQSPISTFIDTAFSNDCDRYIFVIGCARSGTTLLFNYLSEIKDVFLLNEDNAFQPTSGHSFRKRYNAMWESANKVRAKGYYIPDFCDDSDYWFDVYIKLGNHFKHVGSKLAFGPHGEEYLADIDLYLQPFFNKYFSRSRFLLTVRRPSECILSMSKLFPGNAFGTYKNIWLKSLQHQILLFGSVSNARFVFHEAVDCTMLEVLASECGLEPIVKAPGFVISVEQRPSYILDNDFQVLNLNSSEKFELSELEIAFEFVKQDIDIATGRVRPAVHQQEFVRKMVLELEKIRANPTATFDLGKNGHHPESA